ncbi:hypothetical protein BCR33DRAFT_712509 [Rhizoclosmatium globosum]|uniref:SH3 domain-containing protein n=1 Tax=Rhizoclosmatium globosum TaxID=329046 RepID=A0A1Y2CX95_9FUNG|nr:NADPH oxidase activator 1 [Rhizoclosmatium hyalinum]ORY51464.1 hypothetical protein BCR33DRAFT_712509 [Rhizoclosmatium globosum]|eukprot:ORY51464.1 hypothetical protein BCR33DRAFT_712509 [Rhizoclosmatium globosum]
MVQGVLYDKSDPEGAKQGRDPASIAAAPVDSTKLGGGGQGHGVNVFGRKISIGNSTTYLVAIEDFTAQQPGDLDFRRGDTIEHLSDVDENWARGRVNGQEGIFPKSFAVMPNK